MKKIMYTFLLGTISLTVFGSDCWDNKISFTSNGSIGKSLNNVDAILVGEILDKTSLEYESKELSKLTANSEMSFSILNIIKSSRARKNKIIRVISSVGKDCQCKFNFEVGKIYLIYTRKLNTADGYTADSYSLRYCENIKEIEDSESDLKMLEKYFH